jgi:hypothetical protein
MTGWRAKRAKTLEDIVIADFGGTLPRRSKRLLPPNFSQECFNAKLLSGELRGLRAPLPLYTFPSPPVEGIARAWRVRPTGDPDTSYWVNSIYPEAELIKCPLINDAFDRWYLFEPGQPPGVLTVDMIAAGDPAVDLALPQPTTAPTLVPTVSDSSNVRDVVYVYTYVTGWGEETSPSAPATVSVDDAGEVEVSNFYSPSPGTLSPASRDWDVVRIYRTVTVNGQAGLFFVADVAWGGTTFTDDINDATISLNEQLASQNYNPPPSGIYGARTHPSGALVAFDGRDVYFSEPYRPHAWPEAYRVSVSDEIVGIEVFEQNVGVFTKGRPAMLYGSTPQQIGILNFRFSEPCVSYGSILGAPEGAYYASHQGLVLFTAVGPKNITREAISKEEWETQYIATPEDMSAARYGTQYICAERAAHGFIVDTLEPRIAFTNYQLTGTLDVLSFSEDYYTGEIYLVAGDSVFVWDSTETEEIDYVWKSKQYVLRRPANYGAVMVHLEERQNEYVPSSPLSTTVFPAEYIETDPDYIPIDKTTQVLVEVFVNDERILVTPAGDREQVRIPSGVKGDAWEIRITGQCRVYSVALTETGRGQGRTT